MFFYLLNDAFALFERYFNDFILNVIFRMLLNTLEGKKNKERRLCKNVTNYDQLSMQK